MATATVIHSSSCRIAVHAGWLRMLRSSGSSFSGLFLGWRERLPTGSGSIKTIPRLGNVQA